MSKLVGMYRRLKEQDSETLYLFKSGIFYIFLDKDALKINELLSLKLTHLNNDVLKCGFPSSSIDKYYIKFKENNVNVKIIENNIVFSELEFFKEKKYLQLIEMIKNVNTNNLSVSEAYAFIEDLKKIIVNL